MLTLLISGCAVTVNSSFENYKDSILKSDGERAIKYVSEKSFSYYETMNNHSLTLTKKELTDLTLIDRLMVFSLRSRVDKKILKNMDGKKLIVHAINKGWIGKNSVQNLTVYSFVDSYDKSCKEMIIGTGSQAQRMFKFYLEDEIWKIDVTSINHIANMAFSMQIRKINPNEDEALVIILSSLEGRNITLEEVYKIPAL
jgi:hypothetical protein